MNEYSHQLAMYPGVAYISPEVTFIPSRETAPQMDIDQLIELGEARANTLRHTLKTSQEFGNEFFAAMDHPKLAHHGHHHSRHVEALAKQGLREYAKYEPALFEGPEAQTDISAYMLFPYLHDLDQQTSAYRNLSRESGKLKEKKGHGIGAAVMTMAKTSRYAEVNNIDYDEAWNVTSAAATMMMRHDAPEKFDKTFNPQNRPASDFTTAEELAVAFENDELDLYSLSPSQSMDILKQIKEKNGFMKDGDSIYGLSPAFEREFAHELALLTQSHEPLFANLSEQRKQRLLALSEAADWADMGDVICPYSDQITRTFLTQYSKNRPFSIFHAENGNMPTVEEAVDHIFNTNDSNLPSDDLRLLWEVLHVNNISENSQFSQLPWVQEFTREHVMLGALALKQIGNGIMSGDMSPIQDIYNNRIIKLDNKRRRNEEKYGYYYNGSFTGKVEHIRHEGQEVIESLLNKQKTYDEEHILAFNELTDRVIGELCYRYGVTEEELQRYHEKVQSGEDADTQPFENDSLPISKLKIIQPQ